MDEMRIQDVFALYERDLKRTEAFMEECLHSEVTLIPTVIRHLTDSGGKRFRPLLLLASASACGYAGEDRYAMAAMIEFMHTATLLHDDVVDHADMRRGRASANHIWGNAASILVGDFLYSRAFRIMTDAGNLAIMALLSRTTHTMAEGEVFQLVRSGDAGLGEEEYISIIERKTAILIAAACAVGALLAEAGAERTEALRRYGMCVGSAFQITDDTLDYEARKGEFGKAIGKDLEEGKFTLPVIHALRSCSPAERELVTAAFAGRSEGDDPRGQVVEIVRRHGGLAYARDKAAAYVREARDVLAILPASPGREALTTVAGYVLERRA
jgi:octaprenyl-diphosphate synthase